MTPATFLETRKKAWDQIEALVAKTKRKGIAALNEAELLELTRLYPAITVDVARARMYKIPHNIQQRINTLAIAAHGLLYRRKRPRPIAAIGRFFRTDYPILFRKLWAYIVLATALLFIPTIGAFISVQIRPSTAYLFVPGTLEVDGRQGVSAEDISERFRQTPNSTMAAGIMTNNIGVAFKAYALGISAGIGTCIIVFYNGMMLGGFAGHFINHDLSFEFWSFIAPHGILEIFAIIVAAAAGLRMGLSLAIPGKYTRKISLRHGASEAVLLVIGTIPMFIIAGIIEGFITPSYIPGELKIIIGIIAWVITFYYLMRTARNK